MTKNEKNSLLIATEIAKIVSSRDLVRSLKNKITRMKTKEVKLDFSDVEFVSRSAVHEFLSLRNQLQKKSWKKKNIEFTNTNESVKEMFRTVAANIAIPKNKRLLEKIEKIDIQTLIKKTSNS